MQEFFNVTILAVLQGVAEFLPISSSGHLVIGQHLLGMNPPGMRLELFLHVGTLVSIFVFYRQPIASILLGLFASDAARRREAWAYAAKILLSALPAVVIYFSFQKSIDDLFENARMVGALLMFTGAVLAGTRFLPRGQRPVSFLRALLMGCGQAVALLPGVSRSGMTLASARAGRVAPEAAAEFSFLMPRGRRGLLLARVAPACAARTRILAVRPLLFHGRSARRVFLQVRSLWNSIIYTFKETFT